MLTVIRDFSHSVLMMTSLCMKKKFTYTYALLLSKLQIINELMQHA